MARESRVTRREDGRALCFAEWGEPGGVPVFMLHGTPNSRLARHWDESVFSEAGARAITYDRPGYGGSDRHAGRRVVDCVGDVAAIADALGLGRFAVTGASGGGPHALAVAARLPERVIRTTCVVGPAPFDAPGLDWFAGMAPPNVREIGFALRGEDELVPELERESAEMLERVAADPAKLVGDDWEISEADRAELARPERGEVIRESMAEAFRTGVWGWVDDDLAIVRPWGFDVGEIRVATRVDYGLTDVFVPPAHGAWLAANVPDAEVVVDEDRGHVSSPEAIAERLRWLVGTG